ncbi:MAG: hypothetical protein J2P48_00215 [Alphaproteobacteria bacterium]|nr:hypothetical protein [Alphaproteobacteria bacterium]
MSRLSALEHEFHKACAAFREPDRADAAYDAIYSRVDELLGTINNTPPASIGGCVTKLRALVNRELGGAAGDRDDDVTSLRQVLAFLEDFDRLYRS